MLNFCDPSCTIHTPGENISRKQIQARDCFCSSGLFWKASWSSFLNLKEVVSKYSFCEGIVCFVELALALQDIHGSELQWVAHLPCAAARLAGICSCAIGHQARQNCARWFMLRPQVLRSPLWPSTQSECSSFMYHVEHPK